MLCGQRRDLTPQRGLVYDALPITKFTVVLSQGGL